MPVPFSGEYGEITSPNYPHKYPDDLVIHYTISVPRGRISLTLTELHLSPPPRYSYPGDHLEVYGFGGVRNEALRVFDNSSKTNSLTFVSISNFLEVRFVSSSRFSKIRLPMARFKAVYTVLETVPKPCPKPNLRFVHSSNNTSYEGWQQSFSCISGYANKYDGRNRNVIGVCMSNRSWTYERELSCLRQCKPLASLYSLTRHGLYISHRYGQPSLAGDELTFTCDNFTHFEVDDRKKVRCTSFGNYSSRPPFCKEKEEYFYSRSKSWIVGVVIGGAFGATYIGVFVVLIYRYYTLRVKVPAQTPVSVRGDVHELEEKTPMGNVIELEASKK